MPKRLARNRSHYALPSHNSDDSLLDGSTTGQQHSGSAGQIDGLIDRLAMP